MCFPRSSNRPPFSLRLDAAKLADSSGVRPGKLSLLPSERFSRLDMTRRGVALLSNIGHELTLSFLAKTATKKHPVKHEKTTRKRTSFEFDWIKSRWM